MKVIQLEHKISRKYLRIAASYRRFSIGSVGFTFTTQDLLDCYLYESCGVHMNDDRKRSNGYLFGKWQRDITVAMWIEDIARGDICKNEILETVHRWWAKPILDKIEPVTLFAFQPKS